MLKHEKRGANRCRLKKKGKNYRRNKRSTEKKTLNSEVERDDEKVKNFKD